MVRRRQLSPVEVVEAFISQIEKRNGEINAIVTMAPDAVEQARKAQVILNDPAKCGPLHGVPVTIKDTIETAGLLTTAGSRILKLNVPTIDAPAVAALKSAGAIVLGKTNVPEMAMTYETENCLFGRTINPYNPALTPGGSSGGEAAAIASKMSPLGLGSDLSGSIRIPANFCGIFGLKPTPGVVSSLGHIPQTGGALSTGAVLGPMARCARDLRLFLDSIGVSEFLNGERLSENPGAWSVCWFSGGPKMPVSDSVAFAIDLVVNLLRNLGATVEEFMPPQFLKSSELWIELFADPAAEVVSSLYADRFYEAGDFVKRVLSAKQKRTTQGLENRQISPGELDIKRSELFDSLKKFDFVVAPVGAVNAFPHETRSVMVPGETVNVFKAFGFSQAANVFGLPSVAVPVGFDSSGTPIGVQLLGNPYSELRLIAAAEFIERKLGNIHGCKAAENVNLKDAVQR